MGLGDNPDIMEWEDQEKQPKSVDLYHEKGQKIRNELDNVMEIMTDNINKVIERENKARKMEEKAGELEGAAKVFQKTVQKVERSYCWKNVKINIVITVIVLVIVLIIILLATGVIPVSSPIPAPPTINSPIKP